MSAVLDLCDRWDALSKGESPTTTAVREALAKDVAEMVTVDVLRQMFGPGGDFEPCARDAHCTHGECETAYAVLSVLDESVPA